MLILLSKFSTRLAFKLEALKLPNSSLILQGEIRPSRSRLGLHTSLGHGNSTQEMETIPNIDIDPVGDTFKYILLKLTVTKDEDKPKEKQSTLLIRGYSSCAFHSDIYDLVHDAVGSKLGGVPYDLKCLGGGRIKHDNNTLHVYGYSQGYGKADHKVTSDLLKAKYSNYTVTWSNEGY